MTMHPRLPACHLRLRVHTPIPTDERLDLRPTDGYLPLAKNLIPHEIAAVTTDTSPAMATTEGSETTEAVREDGVHHEAVVVTLTLLPTTGIRRMEGVAMDLQNTALHSGNGSRATLTPRP